MTKKHTLLVVDDEPAVGDSVHDLLRREFRVLRARNAEEAADILREQEVHVIMTDQRMPQVSGVEFLTKIRQGNSRAVRMLFTGYADFESIIAAINQGHVFKFLKKPWHPEELEQAVREAAVEYDRLVEQAEFVQMLRAEIELLRQRINHLEEQVAKLSEA